VAKAGRPSLTALSVSALGRCSKAEVRALRGFWIVASAHVLSVRGAFASLFFVPIEHPLIQMCRSELIGRLQAHSSPPSCIMVCARQADARLTIVDANLGTAAPTGLGLGLAVARHLVESHGGTLCAHSAGPDRGSEFVMQLPAGAGP
jgi:hypothetical protein